MKHSMGFLNGIQLFWCTKCTAVTADARRCVMCARLEALEQKQAATLQPIGLEQ